MNSIGNQNDIETAKIVFRNEVDWAAFDHEGLSTEWIGKFLIDPSLIEELPMAPLAQRSFQAWYRFDPKTRLLLWGMYAYKWPEFSKRFLIAHYVGEVEERLWRSRIQLSPSFPRIERKKDWGNCPPWNEKAPWAQRWLDEAFMPSEKLFYEAHLVQCQHCRERLELVRVFYFQLERLLQGIREEQAALVGLGSSLVKSKGASLSELRVGVPSLEGQHLKFRQKDLLQVFFSRTDTKWVGLVAASLFALMVLHSVVRLALYLLVPPVVPFWNFFS